VILSNLHLPGLLKMASFERIGASSAAPDASPAALIKGDFSKGLLHINERRCENAASE
jgi:hypothetical protein